jgi:uncharacterized Zn-binding protein involved in type VI secretion
MGVFAAKQDDKVVGIDIHIVMIPNPSGETPTPLPHPFSGKLDGALSTDVKIDGKAAAVVGSTATNSPSHVPNGPRFQIQPQNKGNVNIGSVTVFINKKPAARMGDMVMTCADPAPAPTSNIVVPNSKVMIG